MRMLMRVGTRKARIFPIFCSSSGKFLCWNAQDSADSITFVAERVPTGIFLEAGIGSNAGIDLDAVINSDTGIGSNAGRDLDAGIGGISLHCGFPPKLYILWSWLLLPILLSSFFAYSSYFEIK